MINITDKAKEHVANLRSKEGYGADYNIRVSVKGGGCSGLMYDLDFDNKTNEADQIFEDKGIKIMVGSPLPRMVDGQCRGTPASISASAKRAICGEACHGEWRRK